MAIAGGIEEVNGFENSIEIENLARFAVNEYNKKENALLEFVKVVNAKQQVVEGMLYYITLEAIDGGEKKVYEAKIWVKLWLDFKELQEFKLAGDAPSEPTVAGKEEVKGAENSLKIKNLAIFAVDEYNKKENALLKFVRVVDAKQQVVSGFMYYITLEALDGEKKKVYEAKIWEKAWLNFKELQEFNLIGDATA